MDEMNQAQSSLFFPLVPKPFPEESTSSWVIRLCGVYQCSFSRFQTMSGLSVHQDDWDLGIEPIILNGFLRFTGVEPHEFQHRLINPNTFEDFGLQLEPRFLSKKPAYAWCPVCFDEDQEPYLRWQWRYRNYTHCIKHRTLLSTTCSACGAGFTSHRSLLINTPLKAPLINLAFCQECFCPLGQKSGEHHRRWFGRPISFSQTCPDSVIGDVADFSIKVERVNRSEISNVFGVYPTRPTAVRSIGSSWSKTLTPQSRALLARALMSIRREMRQNKIQRLSRVLS